MHSPGVEPGLSAWKADIIPLDQECESIPSCFQYIYKLMNFVSNFVFLKLTYIIIYQFSKLFNFI